MQMHSHTSTARSRAESGNRTHSCTSMQLSCMQEHACHVGCIRLHKLSRERAACGCFIVARTHLYAVACWHWRACITSVPCGGGPHKFGKERHTRASSRRGVALCSVGAQHSWAYGRGALGHHSKAECFKLSWNWWWAIPKHHALMHPPTPTPTRTYTHTHIYTHNQMHTNLQAPFICKSCHSSMPVGCASVASAPSAHLPACGCPSWQRQAAAAGMSAMTASPAGSVHAAATWR